MAESEEADVDFGGKTAIGQFANEDRESWETLETNTQSSVLYSVTGRYTIINGVHFLNAHLRSLYR